MNICHECHCAFVQEFLCTTCGAQKLHDHTQASLDATNAAQLAELERISEALGTNEGHSSVDHIEVLKDELAAAKVDAERYRWWRTFFDSHLDLPPLLARAETAEMLDAAIDAARQGKE